MKKILCAILSAALISVSAVPAFAAETSDKSETAVTLKEGTYAPNQVVVKFKDSAIDTDTVPKKGEVEAVGADFGELADASSSKQEALGAADEEADILSKSLGGDFVLEDTLVFDTPQADSKAGNSIGTSANANGDGFSVALVSSDKYDTATLIEKLSKVKGIEKVEPNYYVNTESLILLVPTTPARSHATASIIFIKRKTNITAAGSSACCPKAAAYMKARLKRI